MFANRNDVFSAEVPAPPAGNGESDLVDQRPLTAGDGVLPGGTAPFGLGNGTGGPIGTGTGGNGGSGWTSSLGAGAGSNEAIVFGSLAHNWIGQTSNLLDSLAAALRRMSALGSVDGSAELAQTYQALAGDYAALANAFRTAADEIADLLANPPEGVASGQALWNSPWGSALRALLNDVIEDYRELRGREVAGPVADYGLSDSHLSFWNRNPFLGLPGWITGESTLTEDFNTALARGWLGRAGAGQNGTVFRGGFLPVADGPGIGNGGTDTGRPVSVLGSTGTGTGLDLDPSGSGAGFYGGAPAGVRGDVFTPFGGPIGLSPIASANDDNSAFGGTGHDASEVNWLADILRPDTAPGDSGAPADNILTAPSLAAGQPLDDWLSALLPPDGLMPFSWTGTDPNGAMPAIFAAGVTRGEN
ncbi:MAG: hypothetical protein FJX29_12000 [Alphaproteobacteria bacterium]|nr:hypothetical protein [Alphaproteobacteria bacterium]